MLLLLNMLALEYTLTKQIIGPIAVLRLAYSAKAPLICLVRVCCMASFFSKSSLIICWVRVVLRLAYLAIARLICLVRVCLANVFSNSKTYLFGESMSG